MMEITNFHGFILGFGLGVFVLLISNICWNRRTVCQLPPLLPAAVEPAQESKVDPWSLQRVVMAASDQALPRRPEVNKTVLLYWALILEEHAETTEGLLAALRRVWASANREATPIETELMYLMVGNKATSSNASKAARALLAELPEFSLRMTHREAKEVLDGSADSAVVNAGLCLSAGLPGAAAYLSVQESNLSKRNAAGRIDRTEDGKWIKGANYAPPDLDSVLLAAKVGA